MTCCLLLFVRSGFSEDKKASRMPDPPVNRAAISPANFKTGPAQTTTEKPDHPALPQGQALGLAAGQQGAQSAQNGGSSQKTGFFQSIIQFFSTRKEPPTQPSTQPADSDDSKTRPHRGYTGDPAQNGNDKNAESDAAHEQEPHNQGGNSGGDNQGGGQGNNPPGGGNSGGDNQGGGQGNDNPGNSGGEGGGKGFGKRLDTSSIYDKPKRIVTGDRSAPAARRRPAEAKPNAPPTSPTPTTALTPVNTGSRPAQPNQPGIDSRRQDMRALHPIKSPPVQTTPPTQQGPKYQQPDTAPNTNK